MKKLTAFLIAFCIVFINVFAFPNSIWKPLEMYNGAMRDSDDLKMYSYGKQLISIMENEADSQEKTEFLAGKYGQMSKCAERLGYINEAVMYYEKYIPYGKIMNWTDGVLSAQSKISALTPSLDVYVTDSEYYPENFGARFEPERGVYFGSSYDNDSRINDYKFEKIKKYFPKKNSDYLIYLDFGDDITTLGRYNRYFEDAKKNNIAVMLGWNLLNPINPADYDSYIKQTIDYIDSFSIPVFLRFGAEMNVSNIGDDSEQYIKTFRYVADIAHTKKNIAVVWSPNDIGGLDKPFEKFYPGDEYVDWIGVSHYVIKYFQGLKDHGSLTDVQDTYFATGDYANSLLRIKHIMKFIEENNIKKPVMISECGVSHKLRLEGEDATDWAVIQLSKMYSELIKKYQNIKMINYFNVYRGDEPYAFELYTNEALNNKYNELVSDDYFISDIGKSVPYGYMPLYDNAKIKNKSEISIVGYYPKVLYSKVKISIDGADYQTLFSIPFTFSPDLAEGSHKIKFEYMSGDSVLLEKEINVFIEDEISIVLNGEKVEYPDKKPFIENGRTLIPVRGLFEKMGMNLDWNDQTQTVVINNDKYQISLKIDSEIMTVNGKEIKMDTAAKVSDNRTVIPLRYVSEAVGANVLWDEDTNTVFVEYK